jgi:hypothetical protein
MYVRENVRVVSEGRGEETWHCEDWIYEKLVEVRRSGDKEEGSYVKEREMQRISLVNCTETRRWRGIIFVKIG